MKTPKENGLEVKVGLFLCIGVAIIGAMILEFSIGGKQGFKKYYALSVDLPNASGLLKGSEVLVAGSDVGYVSDKPVLSSDLGAVRVTVKIDEKIKIPKGSTFKVDSSGLLGDKFVAVQMKPDFDPKTFNRDDPSQVYQPGDVVTGEHTPDIAEIAANASKQLTAALKDFQTILDNLKNGVLSPDSQKNLQDSFANIKITTDNVAKASQGVDPIMKSAQGAVDKANQTMLTVQGAADSLRGLIEKAYHGEGLIGQLITNRQLADNFNALVINLREHGVLFYHDTAKGAQPAPTPTRDKRQN